MTKSNIIHYYPYNYPPRMHYKLPIKISREEVPTFCAELQYITSKKKVHLFTILIYKNSKLLADMNGIENIKIINLQYVLV